MQDRVCLARTFHFRGQTFFRLPQTGFAYFFFLKKKKKGHLFPPSPMADWNNGSAISVLMAGPYVREKGQN